MEDELKEQIEVLKTVIAEKDAKLKHYQSVNERLVRERDIAQARFESVTNVLELMVEKLCER